MTREPLPSVGPPVASARTRLISFPAQVPLPMVSKFGLTPVNAPPHRLATPDGARAHQPGRRRLRIEKVRKVERTIVPAHIAAADDHIEISLAAAHAAGALQKIQPSRRNVGVRDKPVRGHAGINGVEAAIAAIYIDPSRITAVRLKVEKNQLVGIFGEIGVLVDGLKYA